jgi:hypothetical protein
MRCPRCGSDKASAAKMERGYQIACPCGFAGNMPVIPPEEVRKPLPQKPLPVEEAEVPPEEPEAETTPEETEEPTQPASRRKRKGT